jgi:hypothetical protein
VSVRVRPSAPSEYCEGILPSCVVVAQRTLNPFAQVRALARQPHRALPDSSTVEQAAVNRKVQGSNPCRGAKFIKRYLFNFSHCSTILYLAFPFFLAKADLLSSRCSYTSIPSLPLPARKPIPVLTSTYPRLHEASLFLILQGHRYLYRNRLSMGFVEVSYFLPWDTRKREPVLTFLPGVVMMIPSDK